MRKRDGYGYGSRRGPRPGHAEGIYKLRGAADKAVDKAQLAATNLREVIRWIDGGQMTGYYPHARDEAAKTLLDARDAVTLLAQDIDQAWEDYLRKQDEAFAAYAAELGQCEHGPVQGPVRRPRPLPGRRLLRLIDQARWGSVGVAIMQLPAGQAVQGCVDA